MKYYFAVLACAFLATALAVDQEQVKESARKYRKALEECNADPATYVDHAAVKKAWSEGNHEEPANFGQHALCISKKLGWQNADGSVNEEFIRSRANAIFGDNSKLDEIIADCVQSQGTPEATAKHLFNCYKKNAPRPSGTHPSHH